jgi:hypothetical protein
MAMVGVFVKALSNRQGEYVLSKFPEVGACTFWDLMLKLASRQDVYG